MNIWIISKYTAPPNFGNINSRIFLLAREFKKLGSSVNVFFSNANHMAQLPDYQNTYNRGSWGGINYTCVKTYKYKKTASLRRLLSWVDFELKLFRMRLIDIPRPQVVIISSLSIFTILYGYYLKKRFNSFLVFEIRDIWPLTLTEEGKFHKWHPLVILMGMIEKFGYAKSDLVIGTMPLLFQHVEKILGYQKSFHCSPLGFNPVDYEISTINPINPFDQYKLKGKFIIGYAGSMGLANSLECFIETIKLMHNENVLFLLVGNGDYKEKFENELKDYNNVIFLPKIQQAQVKFFLEICDAVYLSTKKSKVWDYGQSMNKVIEYMLAAKPIVATYFGYPSMINEANCGYFLKSENPEDLKKIFIELSKLPKEELERIGHNGRNWMYENRTYEKLALSYYAQLQQIKYF
jgi:glycosyltransferase involved in cell wall biosynthesis